MIKKMICIDCPIGCQLEVEIQNNAIIKVTGNKCKKGEAYARQELENPTRTLTSTVLTEGLSLKMAPVRTNRPIPKTKLFEAMEEIKKLRLNKPVKKGETIIENFLGLGVNLISTRHVD